MENYFLCIFALVALPLNVMAIHCYYCMPDPSGDICTYVTNVTDCDTAPGGPPGVKFDACGKVSYDFSFGDNELNMNVLTCAVKSMCGKMKVEACNPKIWKEMGLNVTKCDFSCCSEDKCNCLDPPCQASPLSELLGSLPHF